MRYIFLFLLLIFAGCALKTDKKPILNNGKINNNTTLDFYAELDFEQNLSLLPVLEENFKNDGKAYKKYFFSAWHKDFKNLNTKKLFWSFNLYSNKNNTYYFFNKQIIPKSWFEKHIENANISDLGKVNQKALVVKNTFLKNFPTQDAILKNPFAQSEGVPFDYAIDSVLNVGNAVLISHYTKDKRYAFVRCESGFGFVESEALENFDEARTKIYENLNFITPLFEKMPIFTEKGAFFFETRIGALYPYYKSDKKYYYGKIGKDKYKIAKDKVAKFPLEFNDTHLKHQISQVLNLPYGWGGYGFERDCSLLTRDILAPFGIYLPRNSLSQNNFFTHFDISFLDNAQKKEFLRNFAKPYLSLLYLKGHIMLYAGESKDKELVIHDIWGLRYGANQRLLIGKSVITGLEIGKGKIANENLLLTRLKEISFIRLNENEKARIKEYLLKTKK
ncbi:MAG: SH3 domain-containing protein [Campylobacter sp.]|nr:SH3 domain-containing protein [Campylobacter sp.]